MNTSAYDIDQNKINIQIPPQSNNISSEKNEEECDVLEVNEDLGSDDPFSKLSYEEFKQRNHKEFVRSELIESLGLSKEKMYFELLKPYKHKRIQSFDYKTQSHRYLYICNYGDCRKEFTKGWNILDHARMHENIKPYQ